MNSQELKRIWGHVSWAIFALTCLTLATIGTVANARVNLITSGIGIIIATWMHVVWSQKMSTAPMTPWTLLKGASALTAMAACVSSMWRFIEHLPVVKSDSAFFTVVRWGEYGLGVLCWLVGLLVCVYMAWHVLRLVITESLK